MNGLDSPTTTDRNLQPDAESLRHVQATKLGIKRSSLEYEAGDLEALRSLQKVLRGAVTRLMNAATELRQAPSPSPSDLLEAINELVRKDAEPNELNETIGERLEGDEFELDYSDALLGQGSSWVILPSWIILISSCHGSSCHGSSCHPAILGQDEFFFNYEVSEKAV